MSDELRGKRVVLIYPSHTSNDYCYSIVSGEGVESEIQWILDEDTSLRPEDILAFTIDEEFEIRIAYTIEKVKRKHNF